MVTGAVTQWFYYYAKPGGVTKSPGR